MQSIPSRSIPCVLRSSRTEAPDLASLMKTTDEIIESLVCPPPPTETELNEEMISRMIVPAPSWNKTIVAANGYLGRGSGGSRVYAGDHREISSDVFLFSL